MDDDRAEQAMLHAQLSVAALRPKASQYYVSDIGLVRAELATARSDHDEAAARLTSIDSGGDLSSAALSAEADQIIATDPGLSSLQLALLTRRAELVSQLSSATPDDPLYMQDQEELEKIDASLESETEDARAMASAPIEEQLRSDLERTASIEAHLNNELAQMTEGAPGATPKLQRSSDLANDITRLQNRYNTVDERLQKAQEDSASTRLAEAAVPPPYPASAGVIRNALLLLFAFILVGVAAAVLAHKSERHVYVASHVSDIAPQVASAPSSQLPDVEEVSDEAAEEHLPSQAAPLVLENKVAQSVPQPASSAPPAPQDTPTSAAPRDMEPELPWFAGNASRPVFKPLGLIMSATPGIDLPTPQPESEAEPRPDQQPQEETSGFLMENPPWWMTKTNSYVEPPMKAPLEPRVEAWPAAAVPIEQTPAVTEARKMETVTDARKMETVAEARKTENIADEMPTRLSALRTIVFSLGIKEFGQKKTARREGSGAGIGNTSSATADSAPVYPGQAIGVEHLAPHTQHEPVEDNDENPIARKETPRWVTAKPEFFSWRAEETNKAGESRRNPVIFDGGPDDLQILPSQPGQYKR
jgi:hypothetical protein